MTMTVTNTGEGGNHIIDSNEEEMEEEVECVIGASKDVRNGTFCLNPIQVKDQKGTSVTTLGRNQIPKTC